MYRSEPQAFSRAGFRSAQSRIVVGIPAKDERAEIGACLQALANQREARAEALVVCLNNTTDESAHTIRAIAPALSFPVYLLELDLPASRAYAGAAPRIAMDLAAELAGPQGILLSTDADARVPPDWIAANPAAIGRGAARMRWRGKRSSSQSAPG